MVKELPYFFRAKTHIFGLYNSFTPFDGKKYFFTNAKRYNDRLLEKYLKIIVHSLSEPFHKISLQIWVKSMIT